MYQSTQQCIEFDGFMLNPKDRLLFRDQVRVDLKGKDFDVLVYVAERPNAFVTNEELIDGIWGSGTHIEEGNITNHITKIRNALGDDLKHPKYIETVHGRKGYRFIARVRIVPCYPLDTDDSQMRGQPSESRSDIEVENFRVESHKFVPVFLGINSYIKIDSKPQQTQWAEHKEIEGEEGRLCILSTGVGVWHIQETLEFATLTDLAIWRRKTYHEINKERHIINKRTQDIVSSSESHENELFDLVTGRSGYVLSLMVLKRPIWEHLRELRTALKLLSCLTPLQSKEPDEEARTEAIRLENEFLKSEFPHPDIAEFGLSGNNIGFASWAGVSYYELSEQHSNLRDRIIEFEIAVQGLWWFSSCLKQICLSMESPSKSKLQEHIKMLTRQFGRLKTIGATEITSQRTMCEAILATSRLENLVDDTLKLYNQL